MVKQLEEISKEFFKAMKEDSNDVPILYGELLEHYSETSQFTTIDMVYRKYLQNKKEE